MTYKLTIRPTAGPFKVSPDMAALQKQFGALVRVGGIGEHFSFTPHPQPPGEGMEAEYMLYGAKGPLGRGFYLYVEKGFSGYVISTFLPTTTHDLEDMFAFAGLLASYLGAKEIKDDYGAYPPAALPALYPDLLNKNVTLLHSMAKTEPGFCVSGVLYPLQVTPKLSERITSVPPQNGERYFATHLSEHQQSNLEPLQPTYMRDDATKSVQALYTLYPGRWYILPLLPHVPFGPGPFGGTPIGSWQVALTNDEHQVLDTLPHDLFLERLSAEEQAPFDDNHIVLAPADQARFQQIIVGN